jgi:hypothetical protein
MLQLTASFFFFAYCVLTAKGVLKWYLNIQQQKYAKIAQTRKNIIANQHAQKAQNNLFLF